MSNNEKNGFPWEDIVDDYLETGCQLSDPSRSPLLCALRASKIQADAIETVSAFSLDRRLIVLANGWGMALRECWLFDPHKKSLKKFKIR